MFLISCQSLLSVFSLVLHVRAAALTIVEAYFIFPNGTALQHDTVLNMVNGNGNTEYRDVLLGQGLSGVVSLRKRTSHHIETFRQSKPVKPMILACSLLTNEPQLDQKRETAETHLTFSVVFNIMLEEILSLGVSLHIFPTCSRGHRLSKSL